MRKLQLAFTLFGLIGSLHLYGLSETAGADGWPKFRGPTGNGVVPQPVLLPPLAWSSAENLRWRTPLPGAGWSSPVVIENDILLTAAIDDQASEAKQLVVLRLSRDTGELLDQYPVFTQNEDQTPNIHSKNTHASPTLWVTPERIYAHFGYQGTAALDRAGNILWTNRDLRFAPVHGNGGSPVLVDDRLIFTCDGASDPYIVALDAASGKVLWKTERPVDAERKFSFCTPTAIEVHGQTQVICPGSDCVLALDPKNGNVLWQVTYDGYSVVPKPIYIDGLVFVCTGFGPTQVMAIDPTGRGDVTQTHVVWTLERGAPKTPSLVADGGLVYVVSDDGILTVLRTEDGSQVYRKRLGGAYSASPVLVGNRIYLCSEAGKVTVIQSGEAFETLGEVEMDERTLASPAVVDGDLYIRTAEALYCVSAK